MSLSDSFGTLKANWIHFMISCGPSEPFWFCSRFLWWFESLNGNPNSNFTALGIEEPAATAFSQATASESSEICGNPRTHWLPLSQYDFNMILNNISPPSSAHSSGSTVNLLCLKPFLGNWSWDTRHLAAESHWTCRQDFRKRNGSNLFNTVNTLSYKNTLT